MVFQPDSEVPNGWGREQRQVASSRREDEMGAEEGVGEERLMLDGDAKRRRERKIYRITTTSSPIRRRRVVLRQQSCPSIHLGLTSATSESEQGEEAKSFSISCRLSALPQHRRPSVRQVSRKHPQQFSLDAYTEIRYKSCHLR